jgi:hypothetical protein
MNKIIVVGGGSAGFMTAYTLKKVFPKKNITVVKSDNISTVGVGESTLGHINQWLAMVGLKDEDFMKECNASYKLSIRFENFYKKGDGGFHYPFGLPNLENTIAGLNDWHFKKILYPETPRNNFAEIYFPNMSLVNHNTILSPAMQNDVRLGNYNFKKDTAYHFDATLFGKFLEGKFKELGGIVKIADVQNIVINEEGVSELQTNQGIQKADLYIDCTGFKSLLLGQTLNEPFESYEDILPNNSAWATHLPYTDKEKELVGYTNCTAIENGWVWNIPLWHRMGTGYVYSDKYISNEDALEQFKKHLGRDDLDFRPLKMRVGIHKRIFVKNVCAIGLSAGFIEPLESNGLLSVHEFLVRLVRILNRENISTFVKEQLNVSCNKFFRNFAEFVALHYALSERTDTEYWRDIQKRNYPVERHYQMYNSFFQNINTWKFNDFFYPNDGGWACIGTGMNWGSTDEPTLKYGLYSNDFSEVKDNWIKSIDNLEKRKQDWDLKASFCHPLEKYLRLNIYNDKD